MYELTSIEQRTENVKIPPLQGLSKLQLFSTELNILFCFVLFWIYKGKSLAKSYEIICCKVWESGKIFSTYTSI